ncbi:ThuA domain-containing protein [Aquisphaera insulae]|uniref:ThuA domain-containing protein n=1 Tax=Aquisphaera insulae TaxID=2712864 RepID=UPI0013EDB783|nr:ThuA domain-containing protein [Aquisphaera insulae]
MRVDRRSFVRTMVGGLPTVHLLGSMESRGQETKPTEPQAKDRPLRIRLWCERTAPKAVYPDDIDGALADHLGRHEGVAIARSRLGEPLAGLSDAVLDQTDVLVWWGHLRHDELPDDRAAAVVRRVQEGRLGLVSLYASCCSKPFKQLMKTSCEPGGWREDGRPEFVSVKAPNHPIARGITPFTIPRTDMYSEPFAVPEPESVVFVSSWEKGETLRSGLTWTVGKGRVAYLRTGPDSYPVLFHPSVRLAVTNSALWAGRRT